MGGGKVSDPHAFDEVHRAPYDSFARTGQKPVDMLLSEQLLNGSLIRTVNIILLLRNFVHCGFRGISNRDQNDLVRLCKSCYFLNNIICPEYSEPFSF